jgi:hypothetical protein
MSETPEKNSAGGRPAEERGSGGGRIAIGVVVAMVLYVLSIGPVLWTIKHGYLPVMLDESIRLIYFPLFWLHENNSMAEKILDWYTELWGFR